NQTTSATGAWWWWGYPWYYGYYYGYWGYDDAHSWYGWSPGLHDVRLATFSDPTNEPPSAYTATIEWGDSSTSSGQVLGSKGNYWVIGSHSYSTQGTYNFRVTITDDVTNTHTVEGTVTVDAATAGLPVSLNLATFRNDNPYDLINQTQITWGDG